MAHLQPAAGEGQPKSIHYKVRKAFFFLLNHQSIFPFIKKENKCYINKFRYHPNPRSVFILYIPFYPRKVQTESTTGSVGSSRVRTTLTLCVEAIDFDSQACQLRVKGTNLEENQYVKVCHVEDRKQSGRVFFL